MDQRSKQSLEVHRSFIIQRVFLPAIIDDLRPLLHDQEWDRVTNREDSDGTKVLLDILSKKPQNAYNAFVTALERHGYSDVAELLLGHKYVKGLTKDDIELVPVKVTVKSPLIELDAGLAPEVPKKDEPKYKKRRQQAPTSCTPATLQDDLRRWFSLICVFCVNIIIMVIAYLVAIDMITTDSKDLLHHVTRLTSVLCEPCQNRSKEAQQSNGSNYSANDNVTNAYCSNISHLCVDFNGTMALDGLREEHKRVIRDIREELNRRPKLIFHLRTLNRTDLNEALAQFHAKNVSLQGIAAAHFESRRNASSEGPFMKMKEEGGGRLYADWHPPSWTSDGSYYAAVQLENKTYAMVKENGTYLVYSQVLHHVADSINSTNSTSAGQSVFVDKDREILSCYTQVANGQPQTCFTSGVFKLAENQYVTIREKKFHENQTTRVYAAPNSTFFGVIKLDDF